MAWEDSPAIARSSVSSTWWHRSARSGCATSSASSSCRMESNDSTCLVLSGKDEEKISKSLSHAPARCSRERDTRHLPQPDYGSSGFWEETLVREVVNSRREMR